MRRAGEAQRASGEVRDPEVTGAEQREGTGEKAATESGTENFMVEGGNRVQGAERRQDSSSGRGRVRRDWRRIKEKKEFRGDRVAALLGADPEGCRMCRISQEE